MKILFVSMVAFENNTSATIRNKSLIKGLLELGHSVDIMTLKPDESSISYDNSMNNISQLVTNSYYIDIDPLYYRLMAKKGGIKESSINEKHSNNIIKAVLSKGRYIVKNIYDKTSIFDAQKFNIRGVSNIKVNYSKYDIIISSSDPKSSHLIVRKILKGNKNCKAKWIQYWGDPMFNDITRMRDWRNSLVKHHERKLISEADRVVYVSPLTLKLQKEIFNAFSFKMDYANQSFTNMNSDRISIGKKEKEVIKIGYFGAYNSKIRNIMPLYNVAKESDFILNICGGSDIVLKNTENVLIEGRLPYKEIIEKEKKSDILVCICNLKGTQIPGKIYYSASYMKPIIIILDGEYKEYLRDYFNKFDRFILCENEENSIKGAIEKAKDQLRYKEFKIVEELTPKYMAKKVLGNFN